MNNTGAPITHLRFRLTDLSAIGARLPGEAELRLMSETPDLITTTGGNNINVPGTTLEQPPMQFLGGGIISDGSTTNVTNVVRWTVTPSTVVHLASPGFVRAVGIGTATVTASTGSLSATATLLVQ